MTILIPYAYLDQLHIEIGLLFVISVALFICLLCSLIILRKKKKLLLNYETQFQQFLFQLRQYAAMQQQYESKLQEYKSKQQQHEAKLHQYEIELQQRENRRQQYKLQHLQQETERDAAEQNIRLTPSQFYSLKTSCMNPNESRMFYYINEALNDFFPNKDERKLYFVFPQISLYSFIELLPDLNELSHDVALGNYIAKNVDYMICRDSIHPHTRRFYKEKGYTYHAYTPILLIELDGQSHFSPTPYGRENLERQKQNDAFKNALFEDLHIPLIRHALNNPNGISANDGITIKEEIKHKLSL